MKLKKYIIGILTTFFLVFILLISQGNIGVSKANIEKEARKAHKIPEDWITAKDVNNYLGALLFYSEDLSNFTFSIYTNNEGLSFGYFYCLGGGIPESSEGISKITSNGHGDMFLSLNNVKVSRIEINDGENIKEILIEDTKPFVVIIPENSREIKFYDIDGNSISDNLIIDRTL